MHCLLFDPFTHLVLVNHIVLAMNSFNIPCLHGINFDNIVLTFDTCEPWKFTKEITASKKV